MKSLIKIILIFTFCLFTYSAQAREHPYFVVSLAISPDGKYIAAGRLDYKIAIYDRENKKLVKVIEGKPGELNCNVNFTPDSKCLLFQDITYDLIFYNLLQDKIVKKIHLDFESNHIIFLDNMQKMVIGGTDGRIEAWDLANNNKISMLKVPDDKKGFNAINGMVLSPDGNYFLTSVFGNSWDDVPEPEEDFKQLKNGIWLVKHRGTNLWDAKTLTKIKKLTGKYIRGRTWPIFSPDGKYALVTSENGGVYRYDSKSGEYLTEYERLLGDGIGFIETTGKYFITLIAQKGNSELVLWDIDKKKWLDVDLKLKYEPVTGALVTLPSHNLIVTGDTDGSISVYRFNPKKLDIELEWHPKPVKSGIIKWISPLHLLDKTPEQISELRKRYEEEQRKLIEQEKKSGTLETKYETIQIPEEKQKDQKSPVSTLTPVK